MNSKVYETIAKQNVIAMELTEKEVKMLKQDDEVLAGETDYELYATELLRSCELEEEEPHGIGMVLQDVPWWEEKFASTPAEGSSKVYAVDTGKFS